MVCALLLVVVSTTLSAGPLAFYKTHGLTGGYLDHGDEKEKFSLKQNKRGERDKDLRFRTVDGVRILLYMF